MNNSFPDDRARGKLSENRIAVWLRSNGYTVIPIYEVAVTAWQGPQVFTPDGTITAPDFLAWKDGQVCWVEAKNKSVFSWYRIKNRWVTGIDRRKYLEYRRIFDHFFWTVWLLFLHDSPKPATYDQAHNCPPTCPTGLFGGFLEKLRESHHSSDWGTSGMVYWAHEDLKQFASLKDLEHIEGVR